MLLRVLQERKIECVGGDKSIPADVRVVAATHRDLEKLVSEGKFRDDLYYRLNVFPITVPPLRNRVTDIPVLVEYFIARIGKRVGKTFRTIEKNTSKLLQAYDWPENVRELQNVIERAVILNESDTFVVEDAWLTPSEARGAGTHLTEAAKAVWDVARRMDPSQRVSDIRKRYPVRRPDDVAQLQNASV